MTGILPFTDEVGATVGDISGDVVVEATRAKQMWLLAVASVVQLGWGAPQTLAGGLICGCLALRGSRHLRYRTALVTLWRMQKGLSLGPFIFVPEDLADERLRPLLTHEYGHTIQSLILGPAYLPLIVIPSLTWAGLPVCERYRRGRSISYYSFYTERWANALASRVTGERPSGA